LAGGLAYEHDFTEHWPTGNDWSLRTASEIVFGAAVAIEQSDNMCLQLLSPLIREGRDDYGLGG
jgi:hypothetical protein